ncbi:hypothetical protein TW85_16765 [Marinomonas sp. S3726]|uniref:MAC/perforin domain-containing protein n=1 Tax=Marinomonas sp. S3726 TaxID=579484 RepID=UPI0005FA1EC4|nr:MAC/perforin domain-containing protein [Marinomonas sp. S3726]KJZ11481.1 hypothetical protein TW85_16765 [Marinomonas sp. S3726]
MSNTQLLVTVKNSDGQQEAIELDESKTLSVARATLGSFMTEDDEFIAATGAPIPISEEGNIALSLVISMVDGNAILNIGVASKHSPLKPKDGVDRWNLLNQDQQRAVLNDVQIFRGLTLSEKLGFGKTFKNLYSWSEDYQPAANLPRVLTELKYTYNFSEQTAEITRFGSDSASVSMSSPYGSASANYKRETNSSSYSGKVTEYLSARYIVRKVELSVDNNAFVVDPDFLAAIQVAIKGQQGANTVSGAQALIEVLNEWGWYVPQEFTLGGVLFSSTSTEITEFKDAESEKEQFGGSFKAAFEGIGGGASYEHASGSSSKTTSTNKFTDTSILQSGGAAGTSNDYSKWAESLDNAINWNLASASGLYPSLMLLTSSQEGRQALNVCLNLLSNFVAYPTVTSMQPYLDFTDYVTKIQSKLNPFS